MTLVPDRRRDTIGALTGLLDLMHRMLTAGSKAEVGFIAVNETVTVIPYRQAVLWSRRHGVEAVSGLATPGRDTPFLLWLDPVLRHLADRQTGVTAFTAADLPPALGEPWGDWLPPHALWVPVSAQPEGTGTTVKPGTGLLLTKDDPFRSSDTMTLAWLGSALCAARDRFDGPSARGWRGWRPGSRRWRLGLAVLAGLGLFVPVTGSVLCPAELVPARPVVVRAPLDGVVDRFHVRPNDAVTETQPLFDLDATTLVGRLDIARQQMATAEAEYRQAVQAQVFDPKAKTQVAILGGRRDERAAEVALLESQLDRIRVKAPRAGIAVFDDASEWIGRPVAVGEKVMVVADETDTEVEAWLAVADAGEAASGATLTLFLNTAPLTPLRATVRTVAYEATVRPDGTIAHRVRASFSTGTDDARTDGVRPRLGLKGTARIDGDTVALVWWLFRRPLAAVRQMAGF